MLKNVLRDAVGQTEFEERHRRSIDVLSRMMNEQRPSNIKLNWKFDFYWYYRSFDRQPVKSLANLKMPTFFF